MPEATIFVPCLMNHLYPETAQNLVSILKKLNCRIDFNENQTCCGLPYLNKGDQATAKIVAEKFLEDFQTGKHDHYTLIPSGQCAVMVKEYYPRIFNNTVSHLVCNKVVESTEYLFDFLLNKTSLNLDFGKVSGSYFYHHDCQYPNSVANQLVKKFSSVVWIYSDFTESCCGSGNGMPVNAAKLSDNLTRALTDEVIAKGASTIVVCDDNCRAHIDNYIRQHGLPLSTLHLIDLMAQTL